MQQYLDAPGGPVTPMALLESGIPLSLLLDLVLGPDSEALMADEAQAETASSKAT